MKVLFISSWYPSRVMPTNGNFIQRHAEAIAKQCSVYSLHAVSDRNLKEGLDISEEEVNGVHTVIVYFPKAKKRVIGIAAYYFKIKNYLNALNAGYNIIERCFGKPDILHGNVLIPCGVFVKRLSSRLKVPYLFTEHWSGYLDTNKKKMSTLEKLVSRYVGNGAMYICPVSANLALSMKNIGINSRYRVIYNVVNENIFYPKMMNNDSTKKRILHVSNLEDRPKNISGIIRVVAELVGKRNDFEVLIVGDGDIVPHMHYAEKLKIPKDVLSFKGEQTLGVIAELMRSAHALLLFSNYETLSCVIGEAHTVGIPVIATNVGGIPEIVDDTNGILVEPGNELQLSQAIEKLLDQYQKFNLKAIHDRAIEKYSIQHIASQYIKLYKESLNY